MTTIRAFVAVHLPLETRSRLVQECRRLAKAPGGRAARWVTVTNLHLTLKFLGDVDARRVPELEQTLAQACSAIAPFPLIIAGLGCFPDASHPRIVWAGIDSGGIQLSHLAGAVDGALGTLGFARERRPFSAHVTLGRVDERAPASEVEVLGRTVTALPFTRYGEARIGSISLVKSDLRPGGPVYTDLRLVTLNGKGRDTA